MWQTMPAPWPSLLPSGQCLLGLLHPLAPFTAQFPASIEQRPLLTCPNRPSWQAGQAGWSSHPLHWHASHRQRSRGPWAAPDSWHQVTQKVFPTWALLLRPQWHTSDRSSVVDTLLKNSLSQPTDPYQIWRYRVISHCNKPMFLLLKCSCL